MNIIHKLLIASVSTFALLLNIQCVSANDFENIIPQITNACSDGNERIFVYDKTDEDLLDITINPQKTSTEWDDAVMLEFCTGNDIAIIHCHTTDDTLSLFPTTEIDAANQSDFGLAIEMEYLCSNKSSAANGTMSNLRHFLVSTTQGVVVEYGIHDSLKEKVRNLGKKISIPSITERNFSKKMKDVILKFKRSAAKTEEIMHLVNTSYLESLRTYIENSCFGIPFNDCDISIYEYSEIAKNNTLFFVQPYKSSEDIKLEGRGVVRNSSTKSSENLDLLKTYTFTELGPWDYDDFILEGNRIVVTCNHNIAGQKVQCIPPLESVSMIKPYCNGLEIGLVDGGKYEELVRRSMYTDEVIIPTIKLFRYGERFNITSFGNGTPKFFGTILCGPNINF